MWNPFVLLIILFFFIITAFALSKKDYYSEKHPVLDQIKERFKVLNPKYGDIPLRTGSKSYTENKEAITLCVTNPETGQYYDMNTLMYVALHELSHCITKADGDQSHEEEFKNNFSRLLKEANSKGIYDASKPVPKSYCGVTN